MSLFDLTPPRTGPYGERIEAPEPRPIAPLNSTVDPYDDKRLSDQQQFILDSLRQGPMTNVELSRIGLRFGARLKELRDAGYRISKEQTDRGLWTYTLEAEPLKEEVNASG